MSVTKILRTARAEAKQIKILLINSASVRTTKAIVYSVKRTVRQHKATQTANIGAFQVEASKVGVAGASTRTDGKWRWRQTGGVAMVQDSIWQR